MDNDNYSYGPRSKYSESSMSATADKDKDPGPPHIDFKGPEDKTDAHILPEVETAPEIQDEEKGKAQGGKPEFPPFHPMNNPDGGRQAWLTVVGGFCCLYASLEKCLLLF